MTDQRFSLEDLWPVSSLGEDIAMSNDSSSFFFSPLAIIHWSWGFDGVLPEKLFLFLLESVIGRVGFPPVTLL